MVLFSLVGFTLVYGALMAADVYLLRKFAVLGTIGPKPPRSRGRTVRGRGVRRQRWLSI
jgi:cytochrome bd-type quinol oxidase subunit 1